MKKRVNALYDVRLTGKELAVICAGLHKLVTPSSTVTVTRGVAATAELLIQILIRAKEVEGGRQ